MNDETKLVLLGTWMTLFLVFAGRKFTQPIKVHTLASKEVFANLFKYQKCCNNTNEIQSGFGC